jgi:hypothetical protein
VITQFSITVEHPDGLHEAQEEVNEVISRIISATMKVNPPGEWELMRESNAEPIQAEGVKPQTPYEIERMFAFMPHDNVAVGGKTHGS